MPLAMMALATVAVLVVVLTMIATRFDRDAALHDQAMVGRAIEAELQDARRIPILEINGAKTVARLAKDGDAAWVQTRLIPVLKREAGADDLLVLDAADKPLLAHPDGAALSPEGARERLRVLDRLIQTLRAREAVSSRAAGEDEGLTFRPIHKSTFARWGGETYLVTASLIQPGVGETRLRGMRAPLVITGIKIDNRFLNDLAHRLLLKNLHVRRADEVDNGGETSFPLHDLDGRAVAMLDWNPPEPGKTLLRRTIAPLVTVVVALLLLALILARHSRSIAEGLIASEARAKHMALHDALTGLPNRLLFEERLRAAIDGLSRRKGAAAVLAIDLDRFKVVNDTHGHAAGDELLKVISARLSALCRSGETLARLGGDEFGVVAVDVDPKGAAALAERLVEALSASVELSCGTVFVGGSIGVAMVEQAEAHIGSVEAARRADVAMYRAKEEGRGRYCFFEAEMDSALKARRGLEVDLRVALRDGGVWLAYQPQVDSAGKVLGVEALVRWTHPEKGQISPAAFVPLAEDCGLIDELGRLVMRQAFTDSRRWKGMKVAVNVSALQMRQTDFPDQVASLLRETGARAESIELEITEGALLGDDETTHQTIQRLRQMGFSLALDDFGTGYSSLSYLRRYPIDKIKIDRSFITPLGADKGNGDREASAVVAAIVRLAKALHLSVIAEGVETDEQRQQLREIGCGQAQGFLFSAPVPAEAIDEMMRCGGRVHIGAVEANCGPW